MDQDGETFYGGTTTGDIVQVSTIVYLSPVINNNNNNNNNDNNNKNNNNNQNKK